MDNEPASTESVLEIHSLRPEYNKTDHELYVGYLRDELNRPAREKKRAEGSEEDVNLRPRNIALTGSYGSGKSSILSKIVEELDDRVVSVSLSTLGNEEFKPGQVSSRKDPLEVPAITNAIQKEIVKQLLYREMPSNVPGSRYRRIESFRKGRAVGFSSLIAAGLTVAALLTGGMTRVETLVNNDVGLTSLAYGALFGLVLVFAYFVQLLFHNRVWIDKLTSGPASVSLTDRSESFFDKYLDEIVYFFEASRYDVVVFEDLDRFNDPYIFETLRELNILLNNSKQIEPRAVSFVYAIKDSIFEQLGKLSINGVQLGEDEIRQLAVTNRTKFFDVVIPVVPFISHRNARDLLTKEMKSSGFVVDKALVDLVSKHMVDMRLIKNVHNEFGIFRQKILGPDGVKDLNPQVLFAMVVYKNLNMADFEKVKEGSSKLDDVYVDFRSLVNQRIAASDRAIRSAQAKLRKLNSIETRSKSLGDKLEQYVERLLRHTGTSIDRATMTLSAAVAPSGLRQSAFWKEWLSNEALTLTVSYPATVTLNYYGQHAVNLPLELTIADVRSALGDPLALTEWEAADVKALQADLKTNSELREFLKHATMQQVASRPDLVLDAEGGPESFSSVAEMHLGRGLALDLVVAGYIDRNFSLYVSLYYEDTVTARARNYILHSVETNTTDINAEIGTGDEIDAMLDDAGDAMFAEQSIYNIQLFDHLLGKDDIRLKASMRSLAADGENEQRFRAAYFSSGSHVEKLVARLAPLWPGILLFLFTDESVAGEQVIKLLNVALGSIADEIDYDVSSDLGELIQSRYTELPTLIGPQEVNSVDAVTRVLDTSAVRFESVADISAELRPGVVSESLYDLTRANLVVALDGEKDLALDKIRSLNENAFNYVAANLGAYVEIQKSSVDTEFTISDHKNFISVLNDLVNGTPTDVLAVVEGSTSLTVTKITALNERVWQVVAKTRRLKASYANLHEYIEKLGGIDDDLAQTLNGSGAIDGLDGVDEAGKRGLALAMVNSAAVVAGKRVELVKSLGLASPLLVSEVEFNGAEPGLIGLLLNAALIEDSAASYDALGEIVWPVKREYIRASKDFTDYVSAIDFSKSDFRALSDDSSIPDGVKKAIVLNLDSFPNSLSQAALDALAKFAMATRVPVGPEKLLTMATAGVASSSLVSLIALEINSISIENLLGVLRVMPERYKKLTTTGSHTKLPNTVEDIQLADRLIELAQVSSRDTPPSGSNFRVNLRRRSVS